MKKRTLGLLALFVMLASAAFAGEAQKCHVCSMKIDEAHNVHFRYLLEDKNEIHLGSLSCAKKYWDAHKEQKMTFEAKDFVSGKFVDAGKGVFLLGSSLKVGNGMDKPTAVFFQSRDTADQAKKVNGGRILSMEDAVKAVAK